MEQADVPPARRKIFRYHDGQRWRWADPMRIRRILQKETGGDFWHVYDLAAEVPRRLAAGAKFDQRCREALERGEEVPDEEARPEPPDGEHFEAQEAILDATRAAFDMPPFDPETGSGATEEVCREALSAWMDWLEGKADAGDELRPTSPASVASRQDTDLPMADFVPWS